MFIWTKSHGYVNFDKIVNFYEFDLSYEAYKQSIEYGTFDIIATKVEQTFKAYGNKGVLHCLIANIENNQEIVLVDYMHSHNEFVNAYEFIANRVDELLDALNSHA